MPVPYSSLYHLLQENARQAPDAPAVITAAGSTSHGDLLISVDRLASGMAARGIGRGDRVAILDQNSPQFLELYGACASRGAIAVPINWRLSSDEIRMVVTQTEPSMLAVGAGHLGQISGVAFPDGCLKTLIGPGTSEGLLPLSELYSDPINALAEIQADDPFVILSTAAVAGVPRGALLTHANFLAASQTLIDLLGITAADRHLAALPLFHVTGLGLSLLVLQAGGANVILESFDPSPASQMIDAHQVTLLADFPPILAMLLEARQAGGEHWSSLRLVLGLDAPDTIQRLLEETSAHFWTGFGQSETSGLVTAMDVIERPGAAGRPLPGMQVRCVDERGEQVETGQVGEIAVRGPLVFAGYWRDLDASRYAGRHGWHHTGDLGRFDEDGFLYYAGRKPEKELIKSGGENIYPAEVEMAIEQLPGVAGCCVIGVADDTWGEAVKAVIETQPGVELSADEVRQAVADRIASYKKPRQVVFVERLPRNPDGSLDRQAVKDAHA